MAVLCDIAKELKETFLTFQINHVLRVGLTFSIVICPCSHLLLDSWYNMCLLDISIALVQNGWSGK